MALAKDEANTPSFRCCPLQLNGVHPYYFCIDSALHGPYGKRHLAQIGVEEGLHRITTGDTLGFYLKALWVKKGES